MTPATREKLRRVLRAVLAVAMVSQGINHFVNVNVHVGMMPDYLPAHTELVLISGVFEILGGAGILVPHTRRWAGWGLIALYVAVFPANVHMAIHQLPLGETPVPPAFLWLRLPIQGVFILWAWWVTRVPASAPATVDR